MSRKVYRDEILEKIVKPWLSGPPFVLEEDQDSAHGVPREGRGIVQTWKRQNNLQFYFNCSGSPDLAPIENAWQVPKQALRKFPHWTKVEMLDIATEAWEESLPQGVINRWIDSMPQRLEDVISGQGAMTGH